MYIGITDADWFAAKPWTLLIGGKVDPCSTFGQQQLLTAAGLAYQSLDKPTKLLMQPLVNCLFEGNSANASGAAMASV